MQFLLPLAGLHRAEEMFLSRFHRPETGEQLIDEEALLYLGVSGVFDVSTDQPAFLFGGKRETEDGLGEIVGGIDRV